MHGYLKKLSLFSFIYKVWRYFNIFMMKKFEAEDRRTLTVIYKSTYQIRYLCLSISFNLTKINVWCHILVFIRRDGNVSICTIGIISFFLNNPHLFTPPKTHFIDFFKILNNDTLYFIYYFGYQAPDVIYFS